MARRRRSFVVAALLSLALSAGCREREPETYRLRVTAIDSHGGATLAEDRVRAIVRRSLEHAPSFAPAGRDQRSGAVRDETLLASLEYRELPDADDRGRDLLVRLYVEPPEQLERELGRAGLDVTVLLERAAGDVDLAHDLQLAADRLAVILQAKVDLARGVPDSAARLLAAEDPELIVLALEWARDHAGDDAARDAADRVAELINHGDERVARLAIETIGVVGGPEHVSAVLARVRLFDSSQMTSAYDAIARLGGPEAERFLLFAVRNEDEPRRRAAAERALERVAGSPDLTPGSARLPSRGHR